VVVLILVIAVVIVLVVLGIFLGVPPFVFQSSVVHARLLELRDDWLGGLESEPTKARKPLRGQVEVAREGAMRKLWAAI